MVLNPPINGLSGWVVCQWWYLVEYPRMWDLHVWTSSVIEKKTSQIKKTTTKDVKIGKSGKYINI